MRSIGNTALAALAFTLLAGPVTASAQTTTTTTATEERQSNLAAFERRLNRLENIVNSGQLAQILQQLNTLSEEIRQLRGQIETQGHRLDELRKRQRNLYADLDRRIRELEIAGTQAPQGGGEEGTGETATAAASSAAGAAASGSAAGAEAMGGTEVATADAEQPRDPQAERNAYDAAFQLLREGRYEEAADAFGSFLEKFPDGPYADNAQYWLGEARYVTRNFEPALAAFRSVLEQHPGSAKVPDARLKLGYTLYEMGRYQEARQVLQGVIDKHPDSAVARLAEERLVRMKNEGR